MTAHQRSHWLVTVEREGETLVTIESGCLSGKSDFTDAEAQTIRDAAEHLLSFIGSRGLAVFVGALFRCDDGRIVRVSGMPDGTVCRDSRGRVAVRNVATNRLSYLPEGMLKSMPRIDAALRRAGEGA